MKSVTLSILIAGLAVARGGIFDLFGLGSKALKVQFNLVPFSGFISVPLTIADAELEGWASADRPDGQPKAYAELVMNCSKEKIMCALFDPGTGYIAGLQIGIRKDRLTYTPYDLSTSGFSTWNTVIDKIPVEFWIITQFYVSAEFLQKSPKERRSLYDSDKILQNNAIYTIGFNGELLVTPAGGDELIHNTDFTKQACVLWMGTHYYYNMTKDLGCSANEMYPWFMLTHGENNELIGSALMTFGKLNNDNKKSGETEWFEYPTKDVVKTIVPNGPECLYKMAENGVITAHIYYIESPRNIFC